MSSSGYVDWKNCEVCTFTESILELRKANTSSLFVAMIDVVQKIHPSDILVHTDILGWCIVYRNIGQPHVLMEYGAPALRRERRLRTSWSAGALRSTTLFKPKAHVVEVLQKSQVTPAQGLENFSAPVIWEIDGEQIPASIVRFGSQTEKCWYYLLGAIALIDSFWVPFFVSFIRVMEWPLKDQVFVWVVCFDLSMNSVYAVGTLLQLRTSIVFINTAREITNPTEIALQRCTSATWWADVLSHLGLLWITTGDLLFMLFRSMRYWRLFSRLKHMHDLQDACFDVEHPGVPLFKLVGMMYVVIHWLACAWFYAVCMDLDDAISALSDNPQYLNGTLFGAYLACMSDASMLLVGLGGPAPMGDTFTMPERVYYTVLVPLAGIFDAFFFSHIIEIGKLIEHGTSRHIDKLSIYDEMANNLPVPETVVRKIMLHHTFMSVHNINKSSDNLLLEGCSSDLVKEVKLYVFEGLIKAPFLQFAPASILVKVIMNFEAHAYSPAENVFIRGEQGNHLYFIIKGHVQVLAGDHVTVCVATLRKGDYFGEVALVTTAPRTATVQTITFCEVARISRDDFSDILNEVPEVKNFLLENMTKSRGSPSMSHSHEGEHTPLLSVRDN